MCICCISLYYTIVNIYKDSKEDLLLVMDLSENKKKLKKKVKKR